MENKEAIYTPPKQYTELPVDVAAALDGSHLEARAGEAIRLSTVGEDGWPHAAQLSVGEIVAANPTELLVAIWPESHTAKNLERDGRLTLSLVSNGGMLEMRSRATLIAEHQTSFRLAFFRIKIETINEHRSTYADVTSGVSFRLHDPERTLTRWREQVTALRKLI